MSRVTGSLITVDRKTGPTYYMKARDRTGRQIKRRLGPVADWPRKHAEDELRDWLTDLGRVPDLGDASVTFEDAAEAWLRYVEHDRARAPSTVSDYRNATNRYLLPTFAERPVGEITTADIDALRVELLAQVSRRTTQKALVLLHGILELAKRREWLTHNPASNAERVTVKRRTEFAVLSPAEVQAVARATRDDEQLAALIVVAAFTGLRLGELRALRWRDIEFAGRVVHVRRAVTRGKEGPPKSGVARSVPLIDQAAAALDGLSRRQAFTAAGDYVFTEDGGPLADKPIREGFYAALERAGIDRDRGTGKPLVWHDLRHSFGSLAVQAFALSDVQAYMGHKDVATTMIYVHHTPQHNAADRLAAAVAASGEWVPTGTHLSESEVT